MKQAGIDELGLTIATNMVERYLTQGVITPGELEYVYNRTHELGDLPKYNKTGAKKYGLMKKCPVELLVTHVVDWSIPNHPIRTKLNNDHDRFQYWYYQSNNRVYKKKL
jgi:hypothetical protein